MILNAISSYYLFLILRYFMCCFYDRFSNHTSALASKKEGKRWSVGLGPLRNDAWRYIQVQTVVSEKLQMLIAQF